MNYQKVYNQIIERVKNRILAPDVYVEKHHIIPKCMGGNNLTENLVKLTAREHFICHWLLHRIYPDNRRLGYAFWMMVNCKNDNQLRYKVSSRVYEEAKNIQINNLIQDSKKRIYKPHSEETKLLLSKRLTGKKHTTETKEKISKASSIRKHTQESKNKISNAHKGKKPSPETLKKLSESHLGYKQSEESKAKIAATLKNRYFSPEHRQRISDGQRGKKVTPEEKLRLIKIASNPTLDTRMKMSIKKSNGEVKVYLNNDYINTFPSIRWSEKETGVSKYLINKIIAGTIPEVNGYKFIRC